MQFITCAFINADEKPERISDWQGFQVVENHDKEQSLSLVGSREYFYRHPECPDVAVLQVLRNEHIAAAQRGDDLYPALYLLLQAQKVVEENLRLMS